MDLLGKIGSREARVGVIGLGYVGLPLVIEFSKAGFNVSGFDVDKEKITLLAQGKSYIKHIDGALIAGCLSKFRPTHEFQELSGMDCIVICVPTPLNKYREPDLSYVLDTTRTVAKYLKKGQLVVLESTTYPGTTDEEMRRSWNRPALRRALIFISPFPPNARTPTTRISARVPYRRSWADTQRNVWSWQRHFTIR